MSPSAQPGKRSSSGTKTGLQKDPTFSADEVKAFRREAGRWLKGLREARGLSQSEVQRLVAPEFKSKLIQLVESGHFVLPSIYCEAWANALRVHPKLFAKNLLRYYNPLVYRAIFEERIIESQ